MNTVDVTEQIVDNIIDLVFKRLPGVKCFKEVKQLTHSYVEQLRNDSNRDKLEFPCPYRQQDCAYFNVREYSQCALLGFQDIPALIRHIRAQHRQNAHEHSCDRCGGYFPTREELTKHHRQPKGCKLNLEKGDPLDPRLGLNSKEWQLLGNVSGSLISWDNLWNIIFPNLQDVPKPCLKLPIEIDELDGSRWIWVLQPEIGELQAAKITINVGLGGNFISLSQAQHYGLSVMALSAPTSFYLGLGRVKVVCHYQVEACCVGVGDETSTVQFHIVPAETQLENPVLGMRLGYYFRCEYPFSKSCNTCVAVAEV